MRQKILQFIKKNILIVAGIAVGAIGGFLYWKFVGCSSGQCPITSSPVNSTLYGALMGGLLFSMGKSKKGNKEGPDTAE
jgi:hypothetical protein